MCVCVCVYVVVVVARPLSFPSLLSLLPSSCTVVSPFTDAPSISLSEVSSYTTMNDSASVSLGDGGTRAGGDDDESQALLHLRSTQDALQRENERLRSSIMHMLTLASSPYISDYVHARGDSLPVPAPPSHEQDHSSAAAPRYDNEHTLTSPPRRAAPSLPPAASSSTSLPRSTGRSSASRHPPASSAVTHTTGGMHSPVRDGSSPTHPPRSTSTSRVSSGPLLPQAALRPRSRSRVHAGPSPDALAAMQVKYERSRARAAALQQRGVYLNSECQRWRQQCSQLELRVAALNEHVQALEAGKVEGEARQRDLTQRLHAAEAVISQLRASADAVQVHAASTAREATPSNAPAWSSSPAPLVAAPAPSPPRAVATSSHSTRRASTPPVHEPVLAVGSFPHTRAARATSTATRIAYTGGVSPPASPRSTSQFKSLSQALHSGTFMGRAAATLADAASVGDSTVDGSDGDDMLERTLEAELEQLRAENERLSNAVARVRAVTQQEEPPQREVRHHPRLDAWSAISSISGRASLDAVEVQTRPRTPPAVMRW